MIHAKLAQPFKNFMAPAKAFPLIRRRFPRFTKPFVNINFTKGAYTVKTVSTKSEFLEVLRLRYDVFHKEYMKKWKPFGLDTESFDQYADHLTVIDNQSGKIVGCYRLISSVWSSSFYSETEFDLGGFLDLPGEKLELSRACIHKNFRKGIVLNLLWRGVMEYIYVTGSKYLFGIPSITITDPKHAAEAYQFLQNDGHIGDNLVVKPLPGFRMPHFNAELLKLENHRDTAEAKAMQELIPPLFKTYLKAGAKIYGAPALDTRFQCIDFFTVLKTADMAERYERKYQLC